RDRLRGRFEGHMRIARNRGAAAAIVAASVGLMLATGAEARLTKFTVTKVTSPQFSGQTFGNVGAYEDLRGTFSGEIDPFDRGSGDPNNAAETILVPTARNPDGSSITSKTFARFVSVTGNTQSLPGSGRTPNSLDTTQASLISIAHQTNTGARTGVTTIASS